MDCCSGLLFSCYFSQGDQDYNANRLQQMEATTKLEIGTVTVKEFQDALRKAVYDPRCFMILAYSIFVTVQFLYICLPIFLCMLCYRTKKRLTKIQKLFRDRPMSPVDTAVWWSEYVMRNEDISHLRPAGHSQNWFVRRQIDVWGFLSISLFVLSVGFLAFMKKVIGKCSNRHIKLKQM